VNHIRGPLCCWQPINTGKFTYNNAGRMTRAQSITATQVYTYNGDGLLMSRNTTRYVWDQAAGLPQMLSDGNTLYFPGVGQWSSTAGWAYELRDGLGSVRQLSDAQGAIVQSYTYAPFGELLAAQGTRPSALQYTGEQKDVDTGLVYLRARWYDSATGRFTTRDPFPGFADVPQTLHPYIYALNNPINLTDPSGKIPIDTLWDIGVIIVDFLLLFADAINPLLDECTRQELMRLDLIALGIDGAAILIFYYPGGGGFFGRVAGRGTLALAQGGVRVSSSVRTGARIFEAGLKGVQAGAQASAMTKGSGRGTRGAGGNSGSGPGGKQSPYDVIHTGGNTLPQKVADAYNTTKDKLHEALRQIKRENGLGNDYHHLKFLRNGEVLDSNTDVFYGNVKDYLH
jgi:RHS repeat-associated protein